MARALSFGCLALVFMVLAEAHYAFYIGLLAWLYYELTRKT